jgi:hypothetical protein
MVTAPMCKVCGSRHWFTQDHSWPNAPAVTVSPAADKVLPKQIEALREALAVVPASLLPMRALHVQHHSHGGGRPRLLSDEERREKARLRQAASRARKKVAEG